jgi:hypothetical protein
MDPHPMNRRRDLSPAITDEQLDVNGIQEHLRAWREESRSTIESLAACRRQAEDERRQLEGPQAVVEYIDFFTDFFGRAAGELDQISAELPQGFKQEHVDRLRQIASNAALEQRRCLLFRDKWINRPLPYEQMRPLLNRVSNETRDQLEDYRELITAAARLAALAGPRAVEASQSDEPLKGRAVGRRALFNRLFGK